ncbi:MAG: type II secretion system protein N [Synechococcus sp.]|nr:type II secretion system protein N [Synechococcus sp.]
MDRVFEPVAPVVTKVAEAQAAENPAATQRLSGRPRSLVALLLAASLVSCTAAGVALLLWRQWLSARHDLRQERQLQLLERLGPLPSHEAPKPEPPAATAALGTAAPIRVAIPTHLPPLAPLPATDTPAAASAEAQPRPELLGVVQVPGQAGSAIFNTSGGSVSSGVGEPIGATGWRLEKLGSDQVEISRNGQRQQLSLGGR